MKKIFTWIVAVWIGCTGCSEIQALTDSIYSDRVKTVSLYKNGVEQEYPILMLGGQDRLLLRFDILGEEPEALRYRIRHCNAHWQADEMEPYEYINGFDESPIDNYRASFTTLTHYVNYFQWLPGDYDQFLISGNYIVSVFLQDQPDSILLTRRFRVMEGSIKAEIGICRPSDAAAIMQNQEVDVALAANNDYHGEALPPTLNPAYFHVWVQQNGRKDNERELPFSGYDRGNLCYRYRPENIFPGGNSFRYFDISNMRTAMYNVQKIEEFGGETFAILRPLEDRSRKPFSTEHSLNGGMKVNVWDRNDAQVEADYVWVNFSLPLPKPYINGNIYVVGELNQWQLDDRCRMIWNAEYKAYTLRMLLKQGYYSYQLLFLPIGERQALTATLEGDHNATPNHYNVSIYYRGPADRYDRLLLYTTVRQQ